MTLKRESILAAINTALTGATDAGPRVYRSRAEAFARNEAPAILIEPTSDTAQDPPISNCHIDWRLGVDVIVHTRGQIPEQLAAPIVVDMHSKLLADRTLGGLAMDIWPVSVQHQREQADQAAGWTVCSYLIRYRSGLTDLET
jgi:hypothetical protein